MSKGGNNKLLLALLFLGGMATYLFKSKKKDTFSGIIPYDDFNKDDVSNLLRDYDIPDLEEGADMPNLTYGSPNPPKSEGDIEGQVLSINIANNTSSDMSLISILGNNQDTMDNSNATTQYGWNLTGFSITNEDSITLEYKGVNETNFTTTTIPLNGTTLQSLADALNTLNIGTFFIATSGGNTYLYNYNQNIVFGTLQITSSTCGNGQINTTFNVGTGLNGTPANGNRGIVVQPDGKIIIIGSFTSYNGTLANGIIRLNSNGSVDGTFVYGSGFSGPPASYPNTIALQSDGKLVVGGAFTSYQGTSANGIIRLNTDGSIDGTFVYGIGFSTLGIVYTLSIQSDGKIVVGGAFTSYQGTSASRIIRLNTDGSIDGTFVYGSGFTGVGAYVYGMAIQSDGKIICIGAFTTYNGTTTASAIARLNTNGSIDLAFINGVGFGGSLLNLDAIAIQSDGKIVIGGNGFNSYNGISRNCIVRINTDASIDNTFVVGTGFNGAGFGVYSLGIQSNGKIVCVGNFTTYNGTSANRIIRLDTNGSVDTSFLYGVGFNLGAGSVALTSTSMYVSGSFATYQGQSYPRIISICQ